MFEESLVVPSAVSAFNNAGLALPAFFWTGLLMLPLFYVVYKYGNSFMDMIGWQRNKMRSVVISWTIILSLIWIVLFGGNYDVLRDPETLLPFVTAIIAFAGMTFVGYTTRDIPLPKWREMSRTNKWKMLFVCAVILSLIGLTDVHKWWGPLVQIAAFVGGGYFGRKMKYKINEVPFVSAFIFLFTVMILMQPEFFRFGQLGNLTVLHLFGVVMVGLPVADALVLRNTKPSGKIYASAYTKLKWLMRCLVALAGCLFVMTESVPIFIAVCGLVAGLAWLKVIHARSVPEHLADKLLLVAIFAFGCLTIMPVISCMAILGWLALPRTDFVQDLRALL